MNCLLSSLGFLFFLIVEINSHGMMVDPPYRATAWRHGYNTPHNFEDNGNFCGGYGVQFVLNGGKCGPCGDDYAQKKPRDNENGGYYGTGIIVQKYKVNSVIPVVIHISASHLGHFEFSLCPLQKGEIETEECFDRYPLSLDSGAREFPITTWDARNYTMNLVLPQGLTCDHCSLRWHYRAGNSWGWCDDKSTVGRVGCGNQETYRNCADICILK